MVVMVALAVRVLIMVLRVVRLRSLRRMWLSLVSVMAAITLMLIASCRRKLVRILPRVRLELALAGRAAEVHIAPLVLGLVGTAGLNPHPADRIDRRCR
jgi:hypothetical protein